MEEVIASLNMKAATQKTSKDMKKSKKHNTTKGHKTFPVTNPTEMEISDLPDEKFYRVALRSLSELEERQLN